MGHALPSYPSSGWTWVKKSLVTTQCHIFSDTKPAPVPHAGHLVRIFTPTSVERTQWIIVIFVALGTLVSPS